MFCTASLSFSYLIAALVIILSSYHLVILSSCHLVVILSSCHHLVVLSSCHHLIIFAWSDGLCNTTNYTSLHKCTSRFCKSSFFSSSCQPCFAQPTCRCSFPPFPHSFSSHWCCHRLYFEFLATGWSKETVTSNFSLTDLKITKNGVTQSFLESLYPTILIF